jgi:hypothetical protein
VLGDRSGSRLSGGLGIAWRLPLAGQLGRVGVEAETDLTAALFDERRESIGEAGQGASAAFDLALQSRTGGEPGHLAARDRDPFAGAGVDALARAALGDVKFAEAGEGDLLAAAQGVGDGLEHSVDSIAGSFFAAKSLVAGKLVKKLSLGHVLDPPRGFEDGRNLTALTGVSFRALEPNVTNRVTNR